MGGLETAGGSGRIRTVNTPQPFELCKKIRMQSSPAPLPTLVAHADWSTSPNKRWLAQAIWREAGYYEALAPIPAGEPGTLITRLQAAAGSQGRLLLGFDFPIGLPLKYARRCGINDFLELLPKLGHGDWSDFYRPAENTSEIQLRRPFYPQRPGRARQAHLFEALGVQSMDDLRRTCERGYPGRRAAAPLFWTLGGQQVGKAAICGWRDVLAPALRETPPQITIWPFSGTLFELLNAGRPEIAETYPAEFYSHLGIVFPAPKALVDYSSGSKSTGKTGKRVQAARAANANALLDWADSSRVALTPELQTAILAGFGPSPGGEDPFDSTIGLFGMLNVLFGKRPVGELPSTTPEFEKLRGIEGWILGQDVPVSFQE